ncbi:MAG: hydrogenase nickel incorporation protein HypB [Phycisphaerae bacterium]|nr:hydrogenase nickel incorporation protein HypB [Phycisphaerae bacterium]
MSPPETRELIGISNDAEHAMTIPVVHQSPPNPRAAGENRRTLDSHGVICVSVGGATGAGKTALLEAILPRLRPALNIAVIMGDATGAGDARRIAALGIPVVQVLTDGACRLAAHQVQHGMAELPLPKLDLLIIEDVGGAVCHLRTDLGEHVRAAVVSIAGGHLVTTKYADAFRDARLILLTKYDLLSHVDFDLDAAVRTLGLANPGGEIICTDTRRRLGIDRAAGWLLGYVRAHRMRRLRRRAAAPVWLHT